MLHRCEKLKSQAESGDHVTRHAIPGINLAESVTSQDGEPRESETGVVDVRQIARAIADAARLMVLGRQDEAAQAGGIDPVEAVEDGEGGEDVP